MGKSARLFFMLVMMVCIPLVFSCGPKKAVGLKDVFHTCAIDATQDELGVMDDTVRNKDDYLDYIEEKLYEERDRKKYSKKVWKRLVERRQRVAGKDWDRVYKQKKNLCVQNRGFYEKSDIEEIME